MKIHSTALIDPNARLDEDVEVGPFTCIGPAVEIGACTVVQSHVIIEGVVRLGADNQTDAARLSAAYPGFGFPHDTQYGRASQRHPRACHHSSRNGSGPVTAPVTATSSWSARTSGNCAIGNDVIIANNCLLGGYVAVDDGAFLGGGSGFHQFVRVGRLALAQGNSGLSKDVPPFVAATGVNKVAGLNVVGLRRAGFSVEDRAEIKAAFRLLYESDLNVSQALAQARTREWGKPAQAFFDFVATAKRRGICSLRRTRGTSAAE